MNRSNIRRMERLVSIAEKVDEALRHLHTAVTEIRAARPKLEEVTLGAAACPAPTVIGDRDRLGSTKQ